MNVIPLCTEPPEPIRKLTVSRIDGHRGFSTGASYQMIAASDGSVELISTRKTVLIRDGKRLRATLGRYRMEPWADGDLSARWVYGYGDGGPPGDGAGEIGHWLWLDIATGTIPKRFDHDGNQTNPGAAGRPAVDHIVLANSSAAYHGKKLRQALVELSRG